MTKLPKLKLWCFSFEHILLNETVIHKYPDSKVHGASMGPIWGRQDPDGTHVGPVNFAIWVVTEVKTICFNSEDILLIENSGS